MRMWGPSRALTSIPGMTGTDGAVSYASMTPPISLWSVIAIPIPSCSARVKSQATVIPESEYTVCVCISTHV